MLEQRIKGCFTTFSFVLGLSNILLFLAYYMAEIQFAFYASQATSRTLVYIVAIPVSIIVNRQSLREIVKQSRHPSLWYSGIASFKVCILQVFAIFAIYFFLKDVAVSRAFILGYISLSLVLNLVLIYTLPPLIATLFFQSESQLRAILYGFGPLPQDLREYIKGAEGLGINFLGYYADEKLGLPNIEWLGTANDLLESEGGRKKLRVELVIAFSDDSVASSSFQKGIDLCTRRGARVHLYSNFSQMFQEPVRVVTEGKMVFLTFFDEPLQNPINQIIKRMLDILVSLPVVIFILPPLTLFVWLVQRIQSPGPLFFKQTRYGINRRPFSILKYRTMHVEDNVDESKQASKGDKRIFPFGSLLRMTSLDEFPQFVNALRGEMSVVGPRPHLTLHDHAFEKFYRRYRSRHYVKPGITGLAQVTGFRGETKNEAAIIGRVERDLQYIVNWSIGVELYIILKTAWQVFFPPKSAY
ncbi:MAG: exopolysaccharide biosynthesis polyprenyl glycosylphosphotransferase [Puniceicoccaceae bacterium]